MKQSRKRFRMSSENQELSGFTESQRSGLDRRRLGQGRTLEAMQELEEKLASAAPGREEQWLEHVLAALTVLAQAVKEESENAARPDSLLSDISRTQPWLRNRVRGLRSQYRQVQEGIDALCEGLGASNDETVDFADIRQRLAWVLTALRHQRARESDLIYEAYYDAFHADLGADTGQDAKDTKGEPG